MKNHPRLIAKALCAAGLLSTLALGVTHANTLQLSQEGAGEVLIFPYYTTRNGTLSFISLVNQTTSGKALRLRVRESIGGRSVAELNVFLSPKDVWTAALVPSGEGAAIISNDKSCTFPALSGSASGLVFSKANFVNDLPFTAPAPLDRLREGTIEVIEMATVSNLTALGRDIVHVSGVPACKTVADASSAPVQSTLSAPSGGLVGSMSFINVNDGLSVSYNATGINGFWKTGPGAPVPTIAPVTAATPDLTSGANTTVTVTDEGSTYVSTFARSIDAVSALFMASTVNAEYGYTTDGIISSNLVMAFPTKAYYVHATQPIFPTDPITATPPFQRPYNPDTSKACDDASLNSTDREEFIGLTPDEFGVANPNRVPGPSWCGVTYVAGFSIVVNPDSNPAPQPGPFNSPGIAILKAVQNQGLPVVSVGKEGGQLSFRAINVNAVLIPISSSVLARSATTGEMSLTAAAHTYYGLPMLGFSLSIAKYNAGSPQQNFATLYPMSTLRQISPR